MYKIASAIILITGIIGALILSGAIIFFIYLIFFDQRQKKHTILRN